MEESLTLEMNERIENADVTEWYPLALELPFLGPVVNATRWLYRVRLSKKQALIAQIIDARVRIAFEQSDQYLSVPYDTHAPDLFKSLRDGLSDELDAPTCIAAIEMIQTAVRSRQTMFNN